jgi:hypothetical protein
MPNRTALAAALFVIAACAGPAGPTAGGGTGGDVAPGPVTGGRASPPGGGGTGAVTGGAGGGAPIGTGGRGGDGTGGAMGIPDAGAATGGAPGADAARDTGTGGAAAGPDARDGGTAVEAGGPPPPAGNGFRHTGVLLNGAQLTFIRDKVAAGAEPWKGAFDKAKADRFGSLSYAPRPIANVECGPYSMPNNGCAEEYEDSVAAYTHALLWAIGGDEAHARKAIEIMNAWARTLRGHSNSNGPLQAAWYGAIWPRAGEIIRSTFPAGWPAADVDRFKGMLKNVYLPAVIGGSGANGNWELSMIEASINIAVFLDDKASFDRAVGMWKRRVPAYFYLKSDGPTPVSAPRGSPSWGTSNYVDGLSQETCRDFLHTQLGFGAAINAAETAFQQGVDLYGAESQRLRTTMEFHADLLLGKPAGSVCGGSLELRVLNTWQVAYNHYKDRLGLALPLTGRLIVEKARAIDPTYKHMSWETLTHADVGWVGLK